MDLSSIRLNPGDPLPASVINALVDEANARRKITVDRGEVENDGIGSRIVIPRGPNCFWTKLEEESETIPGLYHHKEQYRSDIGEFAELVGGRQSSFQCDEIRNGAYEANLLHCIPEGTYVWACEGEKRVYNTAPGCVLIDQEYVFAWEGETDCAPTTTPAPLEQACTGSCKWIWSTASSYWTLDSDTCAPTTTAAPTTTSVPTTTACPCPTTTSSPTSSTETPTTTPAPECSCVYPTHCGTIDGECTYTNCSLELVDEEVDCTSTPAPDPTTTIDPAVGACCFFSACEPEGEACVDGVSYEDCHSGAVPGYIGCVEDSVWTSANTCIGVNCPTSTAAPTTTCNCDTTIEPCPIIGCTWKALPVRGGGVTWSLISNNCLECCPCPYPEIAPEVCEETSTPCVRPSPIAPPSPSCTGGCIYWWINDPINDYILVDWDCEGFMTPCGCAPPSDPPVDTEICAPFPVPCSHPPYPTTTTSTEAPCGGADYPACCTSTTTEEATTTAIPDCPGECVYQWNTNLDIWDLQENTCQAGCVCVAPVFSGRDDCEVTRTACEENIPTTTAAPTTTTAAPCACPSANQCTYTFNFTTREYELTGNTCGEGCCPTVEEQCLPCMDSFIGGTVMVQTGCGKFNYGRIINGDTPGYGGQCSNYTCSDENCMDYTVAANGTWEAFYGAVSRPPIGTDSYFFSKCGGGDCYGGPLGAYCVLGTACYDYQTYAEAQAIGGGLYYIHRTCAELAALGAGCGATVTTTAAPTTTPAPTTTAAPGVGACCDPLIPFCVDGISSGDCATYPGFTDPIYYPGQNCGDISCPPTTPSP
jgi:hypothetical protein